MHPKDAASQIPPREREQVRVAVHDPEDAASQIPPEGERTCAKGRDSGNAQET